MNKNYALLAGGALLATTALTTGAADAATIRINQVTTVPYTAAAFVAVPVSTTLWASAASSGADIGGSVNFVVDLVANLTTPFDIIVDFAGATLTTGKSNAFADSTGTLVSSNLIPGATQVLPTRLLVTNITASGGAVVGAVVISNLTFTDSAGMNVAGTSITVAGGTINIAGSTTQLEAITGGTAIVTSKVPFTTSISGGTTPIQIAVGATVPFTRVSTGVGVLTGTVATVQFTTAPLAFTFDSSLATTLSAGNATSTIEVKLTHAILNQSAVRWAELKTAGVDIIKTPADTFQSGSVTFSPAKTDLTGTATARSIDIVFNGSTVITAAAAGTVNVTYSGGGTGTGSGIPGDVAAASGTAAAFSPGGLSAEINYANPSLSTGASSFLRITNQSTVAGAATVNVFSSASGLQLGTTYTSASIPGAGTLQLAMNTIEAGAGITPVAGVQYTIRVSGPFNGYVQHVTFNPITGAVGDLSGFRQGGSALGTQTAP